LFIIIATLFIIIIVVLIAIVVVIGCLFEDLTLLILCRFTTRATLGFLLGFYLLAFKPISMLLLGKTILIKFISSEDLPVSVRDESVEAVRVVDQVIQVSRPLLADSQSYLEELLGHTRFRLLTSCEGLPHLANPDLEVALSLDLFKFLDKVILLFLQAEVVAPWIESINIDSVEPDEVLQRVSQTHLCRDARGFLEVVHNLIRLKVVMIDLFRLEHPLEVETW